MTRRRLSRLSSNPQHKALLRAYHFSPRGSNKAARYRALVLYVAKVLKEARQ